MKALLALALLVPCLALAAASATQAWPIDPARSEAQFSVRKFWVAHARGTFPAVRGTLLRTTGSDGGDRGEVDADLDVATLRMNAVGDREFALGPGLFDASRFPHIRFHSDPFPLANLATGGPLRGRLLLHGETRAVTLSLLPSDCPRTPLACVIRVRGTLSRSNFGMREHRALLGDAVRLDLRVFLRPPAD